MRLGFNLYILEPPEAEGRTTGVGANEAGGGRGAGGGPPSPGEVPGAPRGRPREPSAPAASSIRLGVHLIGRPGGSGPSPRPAGGGVFREAGVSPGTE